MSLLPRFVFGAYRIIASLLGHRLDRAQLPRSGRGSVRSSPVGWVERLARDPTFATSPPPFPPPQAGEGKGGGVNLQEYSWPPPPVTPRPPPPRPRAKISPRCSKSPSTKARRR